MPLCEIRTDGRFPVTRLTLLQHEITLADINDQQCDDALQGRVNDLESQLEEKETLVSALTVRLEQAAEQLDRLRRTGADRGARVSGGIPAELVEDQKKLVQEMQLAVEQWQEMQAATILGRLEVQVTEIREFIVQPGGATLTALPQAGDLAGNSERALPSNLPPGAPGSPVSAWESMKAELLGDSSEEAEIHSTPPEPNSSATEVAAEQFDEIEEFEADPTEAPPSIDIAQASMEELQQAVELRDEYVAHLLRQLRIVHAKRTPSVDWESLQNAPENMEAALKDVQKRLDEQLRIAEVELSLERARLGREQSRLNHLSAQVEKNMRRFGMQSGDDVDQGEGTDGADPSKGHRWLTMLGLSGDDE